MGCRTWPARRNARRRDPPRGCNRGCRYRLSAQRRRIDDAQLRGFHGDLDQVGLRLTRKDPLGYFFSGWHMSTRLIVPANITIIPLPPKCPELNPVENVCQFPAAVICIRASSSTSRSKRLIHLSLSWADAVSHDCTAHAQRFLHSLSRISRSLVLHLGVELGSDQDHDDRKPDPDHEADSGT